MLENWSVILNVLLLMGVMIAIARTVKSRRDVLQSNDRSPSVGLDPMPCDDIIAVRRVSSDLPTDAPTLSAVKKSTMERPSVHQKPILAEASPSSVLIFLLAKDARQLVGYELLQTLLAAGLRFGEGQLFHRHQHANGQGPVLCSVAAATATGMFDMQNMGAFSVRGLCVFMEASGSPNIDEERFSIMLETAKQLSEDLDTHLLDGNRQPFTDASVARYYRMLNLEALDVAQV